MKKRVVWVGVLLVVASATIARGQKPVTENLVVVTLDGLRWKELFEGADAKILFNDRFVRDPDFVDRMWESNVVERRKRVMPFVWDVVAAQGQLYGNRYFGNNVDCVNRHLISYPGYSDMLLGFRDRNVSSNRAVAHPHPTVFEHIANHFRFSDEVAVFATWDAFRFIFRKDKSQLYVNAGNDTAAGNLSQREKALNALMQAGSRRTDSITFHFAMAYLERVRPRVTFIGFDGTDHHAHAGRYDEYLRAAGRADAMIRNLWNWLQAQPDYANRTTLLITTDHGRGNGRRNWRKHGLLARGSRHIWFAVIGPDTPAFGEMKTRTTLHQTQVAATIAAFLGITYTAEQPIADVVQTMIARPTEKTVLSLFGEP